MIMAFFKCHLTLARSTLLLRMIINYLGKTTIMRNSLITAALITFISFPALADVPEYTITIKDHKFTPETVEIPANTKVRLIVKNEDPSAEEFESQELKREKIIQGKSKANIFVGPLKSGEYKFFGEFNPKTAQGKLLVK